MPSGLTIFVKINIEELLTRKPDCSLTGECAFFYGEPLIPS